MQSNSGDVQGSRLNSQQLDTNPDDTFSIIQQHTEMAIMGVNVPVGVHGGQANRTWQGLYDANVVDRFLAPYIQTLTMFNTYKLERVDYTFFIGAVSSSGANYHPGVVLFRALPWTGYYGTDSSTYPVGNPSVLPGCHTWITYNHPNEEQLEQIIYANTAFQRQARFSVTPQYVQDSEPAGTPIPKANFNSAPLQIHTTNGRDNTLWRGAMFQLWVTDLMVQARPRPRPSGSPTWSDSQSPSMAEDGSQQQTHSIYWVLTSWEELTSQEVILQSLAKMGKVVLSIIGSQVHQCAAKPSPHRHWMIKMSRQIRKSQFPLLIKKNVT